MSDDKPPFFVVMVLAAFIGAMGGMMRGCKDEKSAIEHHAAHYDQTTADFLWNDEQPPEPRP